MTEQDKQALIKHFCSRDCGSAADGCTIMPCHEIELIQEFPTTDTDSDTISRAKAIDALNNIEIPRNASWYQYYQQALTAVDKLPPAQPERIKGHWIESNGLNILMKKFIEKGETWRVCDKCGAGFMIGYQYECDKLYHETFHNFCPNCGADMREKGENGESN